MRVFLLNFNTYISVQNFQPLFLPHLGSMNDNLNTFQSSLLKDMHVQNNSQYK